MNSRLRSTSRAFSLVEIALALGIISFAVLGLLGLMASTQTTVRQSMDRTDNSLLFQKVVNQLKLKPFAKEQKASADYPSVLPLPSLKPDGKPFEPFLVDERYDYAGTPDDPVALARAAKVVRVIVLDSADLKLLGMNAPTLAVDGQIATVRIEISGPALGYRQAEKAAPGKQVFYTEISLVEQ
jgi:hypothetical protein